MALRLYAAAGANCCERVRWLMDYKRIPYELVDVECSADVSEFKAHSPFGRVPLLIVDGQPLSESMAISEFIEEVAPSPPMLGSSSLERAHVREICEAINASIHPVQNSSVVRYFQPTWTKDEMRPVRAEWVAQGLARLQSRLWKSSAYVVGERFSLADIFVAIMYKKAIALGARPSVLSLFASHWSHLMAQPAIRNSCPCTEELLDTGAA